MADKQEHNNNVIIESRIEAATIQQQQQQDDNSKNDEAPPPSTIRTDQQQPDNATTTPDNKPLATTTNKPLIKKPPDILCNCPQKCDQRVPQEVRSGLYQEFCSLGDHLRQNAYLQSYIEMRSVYKRLWSQEERIGGRLQRRVSCKYKIPVDVADNSRWHAVDMSPSPPKISTNSKGEASILVGDKDTIRTIEVCQKAFMNVYGITEKRIRLQREKLIARLRADNLQLAGGGAQDERHVLATDGAANEYTSSCAATVVRQRNQHANGTAGDDEEQDQLSIVDTFFRNQLWKPEYIGIPSDKLLQYAACADILNSNNVKA